MSTLTREEMKKKYPLWSRKPGCVWRKVGKYTLSVAWMDLKEYWADIYDEEAKENIYRATVNVTTYKQGMALLDQEIKKYYKEQPKQQQQ